VNDDIYAGDVAAALLMLIENRHDGAINIGTGTGVPVEPNTRKLGDLVGFPEVVHISEVGAEDPLDFDVAEASTFAGMPV
jgi:nucleoside-diphosphate-sugar epimerase